MAVVVNRTLFDPIVSVSYYLKCDARVHSIFFKYRNDLLTNRNKVFVDFRDKAFAQNRRCPTIAVSSDRDNGKIWRRPRRRRADIPTWLLLADSILIRHSRPGPAQIGASDNVCSCLIPYCFWQLTNDLFARRSLPQLHDHTPPLYVSNKIRWSRVLGRFAYPLSYRIDIFQVSMKSISSRSLRFQWYDNRIKFDEILRCFVNVQMRRMFRKKAVLFRWIRGQVSPASIQTPSISY